jgi:hypothetical protein
MGLDAAARRRDAARTATFSCFRCR